MDEIEITGLRLRCIIGVSETERCGRSDVVIDLRIGVPDGTIVTSDDLANGWNYRPPAKAVIALVEGSSYSTVEALADAIARTILIDHRAPHVQVRLHKPGALRFADSVGILINRVPADYTHAEKETAA